MQMTDNYLPNSKRRKTVKHIKIETSVEEEVKESFKSNGKNVSPVGWEKTWDKIVEMRIGKDAPVDKMGAEVYKDSALPLKVARFHVLVALLLSSQTKDEITHAAMQKLKSHGLTVENISRITLAELETLIYPIGFWKKKAKYLKNTTEILLNEFDGDIPNNIENLCRLPGIGPKMAYLCMTIAWNQTVGIGVDTHVHRICNRLKWVKNTKTPEETRKKLEDWLPRDRWSQVNLLLVGFGQQICQPVKPKCISCLNYELCPSALKE
ncbi:Endonuclease III-like protein 1 [Chamberlinius hualienensis]